MAVPARAPRTAGRRVCGRGSGSARREDRRAGALARAAGRAAASICSKLASSARSRARRLSSGHGRRAFGRWRSSASGSACLDRRAQRLDHRGQHRDGRALVARRLGPAARLRIGGAGAERSCASRAEPQHDAGDGRDLIGFGRRLRDWCLAGRRGLGHARRRRSRSSHRRGARTRPASRRRSPESATALARAMACAISPSEARSRPSAARSSRTAASIRPSAARMSAASALTGRPGSLDAGAPDMVSLCWGSVAISWSVARGSHQSARSIEQGKPIDGRGTPVLHRSLRAETGAVLRRLFLFRWCPVAVFPALARGAGARCAHHRHGHRGSDADANRRDPDHHPRRRPAPGAEGDAGDRRGGGPARHDHGRAGGRPDRHPRGVHAWR